MKKYKLYQVAFDGAFVADSEHENLEDAQDTSADMGSKWFFYPLSVIVKGKTIVETGGSFYNRQTHECLLSSKYAGKRFTTLLKDMQRVSELEEMQGVGIEEFELCLLSIEN